MPDEDAPEDPESTRYWANVRLAVKEKDSTKQQLETRIAVEATPSMADALMACPAGSGATSSGATAAEVARAGRNAEAALQVFQGLKSAMGGVGSSSAVYV